METASKPDTMSIVSWTLLAVTLNALFFGHGVLLLSGAEITSALGLIGATATAYAFLNLLLLGAAWLSPATAITVVATLIAVSYAVFSVVVALQLNVVRSFEWIAGVVIMIAFVTANLVAVKRVRARSIS
jgi:hypothetical protein